MECSICYKRRRKITTLECNHILCTFCWEKWKERCDVLGNKYPTCPMCRMEIDETNKEKYNGLIIFVIMLFLYCLFSKDYPIHAEIPQKV